MTVLGRGHPGRNGVRRHGATLDLPTRYPSRKPLRAGGQTVVLRGNEDTSQTRGPQSVLLATIPGVASQRENACPTGAIKRYIIMAVARLRAQAACVRDEGYENPYENNQALVRTRADRRTARRGPGGNYHLVFQPRSARLHAAGQLPAADRHPRVRGRWPPAGGVCDREARLRAGPGDAAAADQGVPGGRG